MLEEASVEKEAPCFDSTVFVIMPFGTGLESQRHKARYESLIRPAVKKAAEAARKQLTCIRADQIEASGLITERVMRYLSQSKIVIADLHGLNPNVMYELGVRHAVRYGTILMAPDPESDGGRTIPFNLLTHDVVLYQDRMGQEESPLAKLAARIETCLNESNPTPDSPVQIEDMRRAQELLETGVPNLIGLRVASALKEDPAWAAKAMMTAGVGPGANTVFAHRLLHFQDEKRLLSRQFVQFLMARCKQLLSRPEIKQVYLLIDSGTTLVPIADELAKYAKTADESEGWLSKLKVYTNNLAGVEAMMEHRRLPTAGKLPAVPIECHLFPGEPLAEYSAIVGDETDKAVTELCEGAKKRGDTALIGLLTGNWIRMRQHGAPCPVPLARGKGHVSFKQRLLTGILSRLPSDKCRGEVFVVTPLGKVFVKHAEKEVLKALRSIAGSAPPGTGVDTADEEYRELRISEEEAKSVSMVATSRVEGMVLSTLSGQLQANLHFERLPTQGEFAKSPLGRPKNLLFHFDELQGIWDRQLEQEFPHERTRTEEFLAMFSTHLKRP